MRGYLAKQLSKSYHVKEAGTGLEAVEKAKKYLPDLILLDYMMPDLNGLEVCRLLKSDDTTAFIPIILLTARADQETKLEVLSAGATDFLTKPFGYEELHNRCTNLIELRQAQVTAAQKQDEAETALKQLKEAEAEVNNPITFSLGAAKALKGLDTEEREGEDYAEILQDLSTGLNRAKNILLGLKRFCHPNQEGKDRVTLSAIFEECEVFVKVSLREHGVELSFQDTTNKELYLNRNQFVHMFINMIQNAIDSLAEKSEKIGKDWKPFIKITSKLTESGGIIIRFEDNGMGMSDEVSSKVLDPFYTTKPVGVGVGLGLSIVHRMVLNHDGIISIDSKPEEKCIFSMEFPNEICSVEI